MIKEDRSCFGILNLQEALKIQKWVIGSFVDSNSTFHNKQIEIGIVNASTMATQNHRPHCHKKAAEIYIVLEGEIMVQLQSEMRTLAKNNLLIVHPGLYHNIIQFSSDAKVLVIKDHSDPKDKFVL